MDRGIVASRDSLADREKAHAAGIGFEVSGSWHLPWERTLFVREPARVPWDLVGFGFDLLDKWDMAAPFDRSGELAEKFGTKLERELAAEIIGDMRQPAISTELVFVRMGIGSEAAARWHQFSNPHLGLLRAIHMTKPKFCALPRVWLADASERARATR